MIGRLVTFPLRVGAHATRTAVRTAEGVAERAVVGAMQVVSGVTNRGPASSEHASSEQTETREQDTARRSPSASQASATAERPTQPDTAPARPSEPAPIVSAPQPENVEPAIAPEPVHVSEEPQLVRAEAEPGAEDGAGASVRIRPPWDGYERMAAREVISRLRDASAAELAAVQLYESSNRSRQTVLEAVERRLKAANGRG